MTIDAQIRKIAQQVVREELKHAQQGPLPTPEELRVTSRANGGVLWTPEMLAHAIGTSATTVQKIERGQFKHQKQCTWTMVDRMAIALGVPKEEYRMAVLRTRNAWLETKEQSA